MRALVYHGPGDIRCEQVPDPSPAVTQGAIVKVERTAICGSDLHIYHGQMGAEAGHFDLGSIARRITAKMIDRHPHVFGDETRDKSADRQTRDWETAKARERRASGETRTLDGVALGLPAEAVVPGALQQVVSLQVEKDDLALRRRLAEALVQQGEEDQHVHGLLDPGDFLHVDRLLLVMGVGPQSPEAEQRCSDSHLEQVLLKQGLSQSEGQDAREQEGCLDAGHEHMNFPGEEVVVDEGPDQAI